MDIQQLGYIGINSSAPRVFPEYAAGVLGREEVRGEGSRQFFRMGDHHRRIVESAERDSAAYCGWQLPDADALSAAAGEVPDAAAAGRRRHGEAVRGVARHTNAGPDLRGHCH